MKFSNILESIHTQQILNSFFIQNVSTTDKIVFAEIARIQKKFDPFLECVCDDGWCKLIMRMKECREHLFVGISLD